MKPSSKANRGRVLALQPMRIFGPIVTPELLTVLGGLAEFERDWIRARTSEGRERAKSPQCQTRVASRN
jgi:hypothetical protein